MVQSYMNWFIDVVLEGSGDSLFTIELPSIPAKDSFFDYTPLSGPPVTYKVEREGIQVEEVSIIDPAPENPDPVSIAYAARVQLIVSIVP